jgi:hypothetical protein
MELMETLHVKKYNAKQTRKWEKDCEQARINGRHFSTMPQLVMYLFNKNYGYVAFGNNKALWAKTKKEVIAWWEKEEKLKKIRGY